LTKESNPFDHPLYLPERLEILKRHGSSIEAHFLQKLAEIATFRLSAAGLIKPIQDSIANARALKADQSRQQMLEAAKDNEEFRQELKRLWGQEKELKENKEKAEFLVLELEETVSTMAHEIQGLKQAMACMEDYKKSGEAVLETDFIEEFDPGTVLDALTSIENKCGDQLILYSDAFKYAATSDFPRPLLVYQALTAIADLSKEHYTALGKGESIGPWDKYLTVRGFTKYRSTESQTTKTKFGGQREFNNDGIQRSMLKHLDLGGGDTKACLQIYFEPNDKEKKIEIGYCGRHLDYSSQRT
jgi:hypothetical protein